MDFIGIALGSYRHELNKTKSQLEKELVRKPTNSSGMSSVTCTADSKTLRQMLMFSATGQTERIEYSQNNSKK